MLSKTSLAKETCSTSGVTSTEVDHMKAGAPCFQLPLLPEMAGWRGHSVGAGPKGRAGSRVSLNSGVTIDGNIVLCSSFSLHISCKFSRVNHARLLPFRHYFLLRTSQFI